MNAFYRDKPLDLQQRYIRLLRVVQGSSGQPDFSLIGNVSLDAELPPYFALSYCWGEINQTTALKVNEHEFLISKNLFDALLGAWSFLQAERVDRVSAFYIWCDQVCINQANVTEKNHQVELMSTIYSRCLEILVWLPVFGHRDTMLWWESRPFFDEQREWVNWSSWKQWHDRRLNDAESSYNRYSLHRRNEPAVRYVVRLVEAVYNVHKIINDAWWTRAWIFQEFVLAPEVTFLIGRVWAPWHELYVLTKRFLGNDNFEHNFLVAERDALKESPSLHSQKFWSRVSQKF